MEVCVFHGMTPELPRAREVSTTLEYEADASLWPRFRTSSTAR